MGTENVEGTKQMRTQMSGFPPRMSAISDA